MGISKMSPTFPLLIFFLSCLCLLTEEKTVGGGNQVKKHTNQKRATQEAKISKPYKIKHRNTLWKIKTTNEEDGENHGVEFGEDYQDSDVPCSCTQDENICSSDKHGSVGFAIDTTASMAQALPMVKKMVTSLTDSKVPKWVLTNFNDPDVELVMSTPDVEDLRWGLDELKYGGGGDIWEQVLKGIKVTLENMPDNGVILVVTDAGTKMQQLEKSIKKKSEEKNVKIFFAFSPWCQALCADSMPVYNRLSGGRIFNQTDFERETFFKSVVYTVQHPCSNVTNPTPAPPPPTTTTTTTTTTTKTTSTQKTKQIQAYEPHESRCKSGDCPAKWVDGYQCQSRGKNIPCTAVPWQENSSCDEFCQRQQPARRCTGAWTNVDKHGKLSSFCGATDRVGRSCFEKFGGRPGDHEGPDSKFCECCN